MDDLILKVLTGSASPFEVLRLKQWRQASPEHEAKFLEARRVWDLTAPEAPPPPSPPPSAQAILARAERLTRGAEPVGGKRWRRWGLAAAAVAVVALGLRVMGTGPEAPVALHRAPPDRPLTVVLEDGSFARLAQGSRLEEWAGTGERRVSIQGRVLFAVAHQPGRPFVVQGEAARVKVLGTRFEVAQEPGATRVVVLEGEVEVSNHEGAVHVGAGEVAWAREGAEPTRSPAVDVHALMEWPGGTLVFQGTPLTHVADEISAHFGRPFRVEGTGIGERRITAWFEGESFEEVAESVCLAAGVRCRAQDDGFVVEDPAGPGGGA